MKTNKIIIISLIIGIIVGMFIGMVIQQIIIVKSISKARESLEGVVSKINIEVDINETKLVETIWKILPDLNSKIIEQGLVK